MFYSVYRYNYLAFRTLVLLRLLLHLDTYGGVDPLGVFPLFKDGCGYYYSKTKRILSSVEDRFRSVGGPLT